MRGQLLKRLPNVKKGADYILISARLQYLITLSLPDQTQVRPELSGQK
jgi:hypothetical protein